MAHYELNVLDYWLIIKKRKYLILLTATLVVIFTFALTKMFQAKPIYQASARVKFQRVSTMADVFFQSMTYYGWNESNTQPEVIRSFAVMEEAARALGLVPYNASEQARKSKDYITAISGLRDRVEPVPEEETAIIDIRVTEDTSERAAQIANAVAEAYRNQNIRDRNRMVTDSRRFVEQQLAELERKLTDAEETLRQFKEREGKVFLTEEAKMALASFTALEQDYNKVLRQKDDTATQIQVLKQSESLNGSGSGRIFTAAASSVVTSLNSKFVGLLQERTTLLIDYTPEHPKVELVDRKIRNLKLEMLRALVSKLKSLSAQEDLLAEQIDEYRDRYLDFPKSAIHLSRLEREVAVNSELLAKLKIKHQELLIKSAERIEEVTIITPAVASEVPINLPKTNMNLVVGSLMGMFLGLALAFARESFDTSIGTIEGVEEFFKVPVLGVIPQFDERELQDAAAEALPPKTSPPVIAMFAKLPSLINPTSVLSENLRSLRTNLQFAKSDRSIKSILFTSAGLGEGKSTTIVNLAVTMAQEGQRVLLVDADLRKPMIHKRLGLAREPGLAEALLGVRQWKDSVQTVTDLMLGKLGVDQVINTPGLDNLHVLTSGSSPAESGKVLNLSKVSDLIPEMNELYDMVLFDTPPILPVTDAVTLSSRVDGTILVYQVGRIGRSALSRAKFLLDHAQATVLGVVLTNVRAEVAPEYGYSEYQYR